MSTQQISFYEHAEVLTSFIADLLQIRVGKVLMELTVPASLLASQQDQERLRERWAATAVRLVRAGRFGPSAGWFADLMELERKKS